jgi:hypothetical protein
MAEILKMFLYVCSMNKITLLLLMLFYTHFANAQWRQCYKTPHSVNCFAVGDSSVYAGAAGGILSSGHDGKNWKVFSRNRTFNSSQFLIQGEDFYTTSGASIYKTSDGGVNWNSFYFDLPSVPLTSLTGFGAILFAGTPDSGIYVSKDRGYTWSNHRTALYKKDIITLATNGYDVFAGTRGDGVFISSDRGKSWKAMNNGLTSFEISCFAISGNKVYAGSWTGGVYLSTDTGKSWQHVGLKSSVVYGLAISGSTVFAASYNAPGVHVMTDHNKTWIPVADSLQIFAYNLSICASATHVFVGTSGEGIWTCEIDKLVRKAGLPKISRDNDLSILYPNPGNGDFLIRDITVVGRVVIRDLSGKLVYNITDSDTLQHGEIHVSYLERGLYFAEITDREGQIITQKLIIE